MKSEGVKAELARFHARCSPFAFVLCCTVAASAQVGTTNPSCRVHAVRIDGRELSGDWVGCVDGRNVELRTETGFQVISLDGVSSLTFPEDKVHTRLRQGEPGEDDPSPPSPPVVFHLADGGRLHGALLDSPEQRDALAGRTALGDSVVFPFDRLAAVQLADREEAPRAEELFRSALAVRLPAQDVLVTRKGDDAVETVRGRLVELDSQRGSFVFGDRTRTFRAGRIFGVVFAGAATPDTPSRYPLTIKLSDGSVFSGRMERADAGSVRIATSIGATVNLPLAKVASIRVRSDRVIYLSDLSPVHKRIEGLMHRPWPVLMDRSVSGGPLSIDGRTFDKGIGVHSYTELTYETGGTYETFAATIGIDDYVRPRGSVVFRVLGDEKILFDSGPVTGRDAPRDIVVDVANVTTLALVVDYAGELDLADHADWGGARLLKPAPDSVGRWPIFNGGRSSGSGRRFPCAWLSTADRNLGHGGRVHKPRKHQR